MTSEVLKVEDEEVIALSVRVTRLRFATILVGTETKQKDKYTKIENKRKRSQCGSITAIFNKQTILKKSEFHA